VADALDVDADPQVLAGVVAVPLVAGLDVDRRGLVGLRDDPLDAPAQLARGPERVDQLEVVVGQQGEAERADGMQDPALQRWDIGLGADFGYGFRLLLVTALT
jgi:hypothetical protein